jgi:hypothetical protein
MSICEQVPNAGSGVGLQNQFNMGSIPVLLSVWKVSIIGNAAVLKTAVRVRAFAGSSPAPSSFAHLRQGSGELRRTKSACTGVWPKATDYCSSGLAAPKSNSPFVKIWRAGRYWFAAASC